MGRQFAVLLAFIATFALAFRVGYVLIETQYLPPPPGISAAPAPGFISDLSASFDELYYRFGAKSIAEGSGFRYDALYFNHHPIEQAYHPPLTSIVLAPVALLGGGDVAMRLAMALAGTGVVVLVGLIGRSVAGSRAGLIAAALAALYPGLWINDGLIMSETLGTLLTALTMLLALRLVRAPSWTNVVAVGASAGAAMLSRSELAFLLPLLVVPVAVVAGRASVARRAAQAGVAVLVACLVVSPWVGLNLSRFEEPTFLANGDGDVLLGANCREAYAGPLLGSSYPPCGFGVGEASDDYSIGAAQRRDRAMEYVRNHLGRLPVVVAARLGRVWSVYRPVQTAELGTSDGRPRYASLAGVVTYWALVPLTLVGAMLLWRRGRAAAWTLVAPVAMVSLTAAAFWGQLRYRAPAEVSIVVLAAVAVDAWWRRRDDHRERASKVDPRPEPLSPPDGDREDHPMGDAARRRATT